MPDRTPPNPHLPDDLAEADLARAVAFIAQRQADRAAAAYLSSLLAELDRADSPTALRRAAEAILRFARTGRPPAPRSPRRHATTPRHSTPRARHAHPRRPAPAAAPHQRRRGIPHTPPHTQRPSPIAPHRLRRPTGQPARPAPTTQHHRPAPTCSPRPPGAHRHASSHGQQRRLASPARPARTARPHAAAAPRPP